MASVSGWHKIERSLRTASACHELCSIKHKQTGKLENLHECISTCLSDFYIIKLLRCQISPQKQIGHSCIYI